MRIALTTVVLLLTPSIAHAGQPVASDFVMRTMTPGQSIGPLHLGMSHADIVSTMGRRADNTYHVGQYTDDVWTLDKAKRIEVIYRHGRAIQIQLNRRPNILVTNFDKLSTNGHWNLKYRTYDFDGRDGAAWAGYYFDDVGRGVCFDAGSQDDFIATEELPEEIIVHAPGSHALPIYEGILGQRNKAENAYRTQADAVKGGRG